MPRSFRTPTLAAALFISGCAQTQHPVARAALGRAISFEEVEARMDAPGPITLSRITAADWEVDLGGLLNLEHPRAREAELSDHPESIQIYFYVLEHPTYGTYLIDSGVGRKVAQRADDMPVSSLLRRFMNLDALEVHVDTATWLEGHGKPVGGVFLTHLHLDHILGLPDLPRTVPLYVGPGEARDARFMHLLTRGTTNANLDGFGPLMEWDLEQSDSAPFAVVDVFSDGSLYGLHAPGHTAGNMAFVVRTGEGPHLIAGDGCHTAWGWEHDVEPGTFNGDGPQATETFSRLRAFAARHPSLVVHLGHQSLAATAS
jgi:N-acyl homoserine lactone hydrolase